MEYVCTISMAFVSSGVLAKGNTMKNNVKILLAAWGQNCARKDTLDPAKGITPKRDVNLETFVLTSIKKESLNGQENGLEKKVKLLETLMIEMTKKMSQLESEVEDLKSINSCIKSIDPSVKKGEEIFYQTHNENKPGQNVIEHGASVKKDEDLKEKMQDQNDHSVKYHGKPIVANNKEEVVNESEKETSKPLNLNSNVIYVVLLL